MSGNRLQNLQNWTNKHVFSNSLDYWNQDIHNVPSYQNPSEAGRNSHLDGIFNESSAEQLHLQLEPIQEQPMSEQSSANGKESSEEHDDSEEPISALQAAWNVTNAIQGMFIVGLPIAVKVI